MLQIIVKSVRLNSRKAEASPLMRIANNFCPQRYAIFICFIVINTTPTPREDGDGREEGIMLAKAAPKDVITESVQEFTPEQLKNLNQQTNKQLK